MPEFSKKAIAWECTECGARYTKSFMQCAKCHGIDTAAPIFGKESKAKLPKQVALRKAPGVGSSSVFNITEIQLDDSPRLDTGSSELNRVLGGGMATDGIISIAGSPGAGKSTLMMQVAAYLAQTMTVLYVSGEESGRGLRERADRLQVIDETTTRDDIDLNVVFEADIDILLDKHIPAIQPQVIVVDSINMIYSSSLDGSPQSDKQLMYCAVKLQEYAKARNVAVFLVAQVTKDEKIAGTNKFAHLADVNLFLSGDEQHAFRMLRSLKNRWENTGEVGVFKMRGRGLIDVPNPSEEFLAERMVSYPGSAVAVIMEGQRPMMVEVQALTSLGNGGNPLRHLWGFQKSRTFIPMAISRRLPYVDLVDEDITTNVVGGITIQENAADLAMAIAIVSSQHDVPVPADWVGIGEIGLTGEVRSVPRIEARLKEAAKGGFKHVIIANLREAIDTPKGIRVHQVKTVDEAMRLMFKNVIPFDDFEEE